MEQGEISAFVDDLVATTGVKFLRRKDLDEWTRLEIAAKMNSRGPDDWGLVSDLAEKFGVSRQFLYDNHERFSLLLHNNAPPPSRSDEDEFIHRLILCLRLHCGSPIDGIVRTLYDMGWSPGSAGHVSEFLRDVGAACEIEVPPGTKPIALLLDETFANSRPILVVMEAQSHYILSARLAPDRKAATWETELRNLQKQGVDIELLVKDQGASLKAAAETLGLPERADLFHLLKPFDPFLPSRERRAYGAIAEEMERERVFDNRKTEEALLKALGKCDSATAEMERAIRDYDDYDYLHACLHEAFDSFTQEGGLRTRQMAEDDIGAALSLFKERFGDNGKIAAAVKFLRKNLKDYWGYFDQLEDVIRRNAVVIPEYALLSACLSWQLDRKSMAVKSWRRKKKLACQSKEWMEFALAQADDKLRHDVEELLSELDWNVRSSSPLEAVNSVIRATLNSCRSQLTQETLAMLVVYINNKKATRGKYAGTSPYERLTGKVVNESPIQRLAQLSPRAGSWNLNASLPGEAIVARSAA